MTLQTGDSRVFGYYPRLERVRAFVSANLTDDISLATAARVAGLEERYFSAYFRAKTGLCFRDWLAGMRIGKAVEALEAQDVQITTIAFAVGFRNLRTFERAFKRNLGMTPRAFKRSVQPRLEGLRRPPNDGRPQPDEH